MHPVKNIATGKDEDLTEQFKDHLQSLKRAADAAESLADCDCPYAAEARMSDLQDCLRKCIQVVTTASNYFQYAVPSTPWKAEAVKECYKEKKRSNAEAFLDKLVKAYTKETGKAVYNCEPGHNSAGDFALWLAGKMMER